MSQNLSSAAVVIGALRVSSKVGNRPVNMHIDLTSGHYWFKPVITGRLVVEWSIEKNMVIVKILSISYPYLLDSSFNIR